ncbi:MAG: hypothetical protein HY240_07485 [Actinobacteria bacterium]|nr:hypothetical protein [Actinomycetota bacterium]
MKASSRLRGFVKLRPEVEGVLQRVGLDTWDLLLVDVTGLWVRDEFRSEEEAREACRSLGVPCHDGWDDPRMARRMNGRDHWGTAEGQRRAL